jgi:E3 ubiquitin-protein ligase TRIP12
VDEYVKLVVDAIVGSGLQPAVRAFKEGFSAMFPVSDLKAFSLEELVMMFGNADEDWGIESVYTLPDRHLVLKLLQL